MGEDGPNKVPSPPGEDDDAEARVKLIENGATQKSDGGMAAADRIERENGETERKFVVIFDSIPVILEHLGGQFSRADFALGDCSKEVQILQFGIDDPPPHLRDEVH